MVLKCVTVTAYTVGLITYSIMGILDNAVNSSLYRPKSVSATYVIGR